MDEEEEDVVADGFGNSIMAGDVEDLVESVVDVITVVRNVNLEKVAVIQGVANEFGFMRMLSIL